MMNAREEKRAAFNEQMNEWVSRQGLWFQLRHAADGQTMLARMARVGIRLLILFAVVLLIFWVYLLKRVESEGFKTELEASIEETLNGADCKLGSIKKEREVASIASLEMDGTKESFFHSVTARRIRLDMELTDGFLGQWNGGGITIDTVALFIKGGASDDQEAADSFGSLFVDHPDFTYEWIEVGRADVSWGYSDTNRGSIKGSQMNADRVADGWRLVFKGGTFSQNWLRDLQIEKMVILCNEDGVHIKEADLVSGGGSLSFQLNMGSGSQPQAAGVMEIKSMPVKTLLPTRFHDWIEGVVSGGGTIHGSTNSQQGITMDINLRIDDGDTLILRDTLPLLSALSVVDLYNSYRKVSFNEGSCRVRTGGDRLEISKINLRAGDLLHLVGDIIVRSPTGKEIAEALQINDVKIVTDVLSKNWKMDDELLDSSVDKTSLADAAKGVGDVVSGNGPERPAANVLETSILSEQHVRRFGGLVKVGLKHDAFDKAPRLKEAYPLDPTSGRIWLDVPLKGRLQTLTLGLAERLYVLGRNRR